MTLIQISTEALYRFADVGLYIVHIAVILFNLLGWIWIKTLRAHLIVIAATAFSWVALGFWFGFGYCFITDWQWQIKRKLGETGLPASFITWFFHSVGIPAPPSVVDWITAVTFGLAAALSLYRNIRLNNQVR